ncbi:glucuronyl hydrolase [Puteibacter caeruleilacunae]|nr:glucuronyl hydrolase [Puteibacter caeruleilacunae]
MNRIKLLVLLVGIAVLTACQNGVPEWYENGLRTAHVQLLEGAKEYEQSGLLPRSTTPTGKVHLGKPANWTSGFYPGNLWLMYKMTGDEELKQLASSYNSLLKGQEYNTGTHDLGFMLYCSFGNGLDETSGKDYRELLLKGAQSLISRYNPKVGAIRSWDFGEWEFPVIIDNMMNLEMLFWASKETGNSLYSNIAVRHANTTLKNHFRDNFSTYHVVSYDTISGAPVSKGTYQGFSNSSSWARGQAWALYGYTMCYRETGNKAFLKRAKEVAGFVLPQISRCDDCIPYWDFDAPGIPDVPRDASAAAIIASALLELQNYVDNSENYMNIAEKILISLSSPKYLAEEGSNNYFILKHSTGSYPHNSEVDVPLVYADYYYLEAMRRYGELRKF